MARGKLGRAKKGAAKRAFRVLRRVLPRRVAKAGANRVGQVTKLKARRSRRRTSRRSSRRSRRRY